MGSNAGVAKLMYQQQSLSFVHVYITRNIPRNLETLPVDGCVTHTNCVKFCCPSKLFILTSKLFDNMEDF